jgi:hypothetical protein
LHEDDACGEDAEATGDELVTLQGHVETKKLIRNAAASVNLKKILAEEEEETTDDVDFVSACLE